MIKIPKTEPEYTVPLNLRITIEEKKEWKKFQKGNGYASLSHMVRRIINDRIEGILTPFQKDSEISNKVQNLDSEYREILKTQNEILKLIAQKTPKEKPSYSEYKRELILNLLREKPRNEKELASLLGINDIDIMVLLNDLLEMSLIKRSEKAKTKFEVLL